jgi:alanyl-tRNA synthetase
MRTKVISIHQAADHTALELADTDFHPKGGGQPGDCGAVTRISDGKHKHYNISDTYEHEGRVYHRLAHQTLEFLEGDVVDLVRDEWKHQKLSRMHTGEHLFFGSLKRVVKDVMVDKVDLDENESSLFVRAEDLNIDHLIAAERLANQMIKENRQVLLHKVDKHSVQEIDGVRIRPERIKGNTVTVIEIKDFDKSACCGTHVMTTKEIGPILVTKFNTVKRGYYEVRFKLDPIDDLFLFADIARRIRTLTNIDYQDLTSGVKSMIAEREEQKEKIRELSSNIEVDIKQESVNGITVYSAVFPGINKRDFIEKVNSITTEDSLICFVNKGEKQSIALRSTNPQNTSAAELLKNLFSKVKGQGGGNPQLAQGSFEAGSAEEVFAALKELL